jgi:hypothetical protein
VAEPVLIVPSDTGESGWTERKREAIGRATTQLERHRVVWFNRTAHDIHVHRPGELARLMLEALADGFFAS